jgi:hypothetical protein
MKKYGSKDVVRMEAIKEKSKGDYLDQIMYAYNMAVAITEPGKAMARGFAAQEIFGEQSVIGQVFFERAFGLSGGRDVRPVASVNAWEDTEEGIEGEYEGIPINEQPASRRENKLLGKGPRKFGQKCGNIIALGKINVIKGTGPQFNLYDYPSGTIEVWDAGKEKYRLIYTSHYDPISRIGDERDFKYDAKTVKWKMVDYIEVNYISNLAPMYGKSIMFFNYD